MKKIKGISIIMACIFSVLALGACVSATGGEETAVKETKDTTASGFIPADDPNIQYLGRIDFKKPLKPRFAFPGVQISAVFEGTSLSMKLNDTGDQDFYNVYIDDQEAFVLQTQKGSQDYVLAKGLADGIHKVRLYKRTEALCGVSTFEGFTLDAGKKLLQPEALPERKIEFIGDSITCGYGNMVSVQNPNGYSFTPKNENSELSWAAISSKALNAQFVSTSYSGRGMFRNYDGSEQGTLPKLYKTILPDNGRAAVWDPANYKPDLIVINLGTNDYSSLQFKKDLASEAFDAAYIQTYKDFLAQLREYFGAETKILCVVGPMISGENWTRIQTAVSGMVADFNDSGDAEIYYLKLNPQQAPYGEDWHPSLATHKIMADATVARIKEITGW